MARLTITLSEETHRAVKETALRRGLTIAALIEESLKKAGIKSEESALEIVRRARERSNMSEDEAMALAVEVTRDVRRQVSEERRRAAEQRDR